MSSAIFIQTTPGDEGSKGRVFRATVLGYITADALWGNSSTSATTRPVWMALTAPSSSLKPVLAAIRSGVKMAIGDKHDIERSRSVPYVEFLKSAGYRFFSQEIGDGETVVTVYLPELFDRDPGQVSEAIKCIVTVPSWWADDNIPSETCRSIIGEAVTSKRWVAHDDDKSAVGLVDRLSCGVNLVIDYIDKRIKAPIPPTDTVKTRFFVSLLESGVVGFVSDGVRYRSRRLDSGAEMAMTIQMFKSVFSVRGSVSDVERLLTEVVQAEYGSVQA